MDQLWFFLDRCGKFLLRIKQEIYICCDCFRVVEDEAKGFTVRLALAIDVGAEEQRGLAYSLRGRSSVVAVKISWAQ